MGISHPRPGPASQALGILSLLALATFLGCDVGALSPPSTTHNALVGEGGGNSVSIDLGDRHGCSIRSDGKVFCWGANEHRQADPASSATMIPSMFTAAPVALPWGPSIKAVELAAASNFSCVRDDAGLVSCWGSNGDGIIPGVFGDIAPTSFPLTVAGESAWRTARAITAGQRHVCALLDDGRVGCRGSNASGQLGATPVSADLAPVSFAGGTQLTSVVKIVAGGAHTCALNVEGQVFCWGNWQGTGTITGVTLVPFGIGAIDLTAGGGVTGGGHTCAVLSDHSVWCWGANASGQLGNGTTTSSSFPVAVVGLPAGVPVVGVAAGDRHTCAVALNDQVFCWGANGLLQTGRAPGSVYTSPNASEPVSIAPGLPMLRPLLLAAGSEFTCASVLNGTTLNDGGIQCWGSGGNGQLGNGSTTTSQFADLSFTPDIVCGAGTFYSSPHGGPMIDTGDDHTCALVEHTPCSSSAWYYARGVACWGRNNLGQLGNAAGGSASSVPLRVTGLPGEIISLSVGGNHACAVDTRGAVWCWGDNSFGQCGNSIGGTATARVVTMPERAVQVSCGANHTCAVLGNGHVRCWGSNSFGKLGITPQGSGFLSPTDLANIQLPTATPTEVRCGVCPGSPALDRVVQVSAGEDVTCARMDTGRVRCWGRNPKSGPDTPTAPSRILGCGNDHRFCVNTVETPNRVTSIDMLPHAGGDNANLGVGLRAMSISMHQMGGCITQAVQPAGAVVCWGSFADGLLGDGTLGEPVRNAITGITTNVTPNLRTVRHLNPIGGADLGPLTNIASVNGGARTKCAISNSSNVWCWGANPLGQGGTFTSVPSMTRAQAVTVVAGSTLLGGAIGAMAGRNHSCAMMSDNRVFCWGSNAFGNLGTTSASTHVAAPVTFTTF